MDLNQTDWELKCIKDDNSIIIDVRADHEVAEGIIPVSYTHLTLPTILLV